MGGEKKKALSGVLMAIILLTVFVGWKFALILDCFIVLVGGLALGREAGIRLFLLALGWWMLLFLLSSSAP